METKDFPYPLGAKKYVQLTETEKEAITSALDAGWKKFCMERHDILGRAAKTVAGDAQEWETLSLEDKRERLGLSNITVSDEWLVEGWPYHGITSKLIKFGGMLTRCHYAVLTSGIPVARQTEILQQTKVVEQLDEKYRKDAREVGPQIQRCMLGESPPKTKAELVSQIETVLDKEHYVDKYMEMHLGKESPSWAEFAAYFDAMLQSVP